MSIIVDISEVITAFREDAQQRMTATEIEKEIEDTIRLSVSEGIETIAHLDDSSVDDYLAMADFKVDLNAGSPEENLTIELSDLLFKGLVNHALNLPCVSECIPTDKFKLIEDRYLIIETR